MSDEHTKALARAKDVPLTPFTKHTSFGRTLVWNLPAGRTCPGRGECSRWCYGCRGRYRMDNVAIRHAANLALTHDHGAFLLAVIKQLKRSRGVKAVRVHGTGDFYSQRYLDDWWFIAKLFPDIRFYCYTTSWHLDWTRWKSLPQCRVVFSTASRYDLSELTLTDPTVNVVAPEHVPYYAKLRGWVCGDDDDAHAAHGRDNIYLTQRWVK